MTRSQEKVSAKFERVFEQIDDLKATVVRLEERSAADRDQLKQVVEKIDTMSATLNQIIGKESVRAGVYGVIGSVVAGIVVWLFSLIKGS